MAYAITQKPGEEVLLTLRKNPNKFGSSIVKFLIMIGIAVALFLFIDNQYVLLAALALVLIAFSYGFYYFLIWFYDVYIITNRRVVLVNQKSLFSREFVETDLDKVHDVTYSVKGIFATIFKYGTVTIRTSTGLTLELTDLSDPDEIQEMITNLADVTHKHKKSNMTAQELIDYIRGAKK